MCPSYIHGEIWPGECFLPGFGGVGPKKLFPDGPRMGRKMVLEKNSQQPTGKNDPGPARGKNKPGTRSRGRVRWFLAGMSLFLAAPLFALELSITYTGKSQASLTRYDSTSQRYDFDLSNGVSGPLTGFTVNVYDSGDSDVTSDFSVGTVTYNGSGSEYYVTLTPRNSAAAATGYYIGLTKADTGDGYTITTEETTKNPGDLADGEFEVTYATMTAKYVSRSDDQINQHESSSDADDSLAGSQYRFRVYYPNGVNEYTSADPTIRVYDGTDTDVTADFNIANLGYNLGAWQVDIQALEGTSVGSGHYISVEINDGDTLAEKASNEATGTATDGGLGTTDGEFEVIGGVLHIVYDSRDNAVISSNDGTGTNYDYYVRYQDGTNASDATGNYLIEVLDAGNSLVTGSDGSGDISQFSIGSPSYASGTGLWTVNVEALASATAQTGYRLQISKTADGGSPTDRATLGAYRSTASTSADGNGNVGLGSTNGVFEVQAANLNLAMVGATYGGNVSDSAITRGDDTAGEYIQFEYRVYYPDLTTRHTTNGGDYNFIIYDGASDESANFERIAGPTYGGSCGNDATGSGSGTACWTVQFRAYNSAPVSGGYSLSISKTATSDSESMAAENSTVDLGSPGGEFAVNNETNLTISPTGPLVNPSVNRGIWDGVGGQPGTGVQYKFQAQYQDGTQEDDDTGYSVVIDNGGDVTADFYVDGPTHDGSDWVVWVYPRTSAAISGTYQLQISKAAGGEGDSQTTAVNTANFAVTEGNLSVAYDSLSATAVERGQAIGSGLTYYYRVFYEDGATEHTTDAGNYAVAVYDSGDADDSADFNIGTPSYGAWGAGNCGGAASCWQVQLAPLKAATVATDYYIGVSRSATDDLTEETTKNPGDLADGHFDVNQATLNFSYHGKSAAGIEKNDTTSAANAIFHYYDVTYDNGTELETTDAGEYQLDVLKGGVQVASRAAGAADPFTTSGPAFEIYESTYGAYGGANCGGAGSCWRVRVNALTTDGPTNGNDYQVRLSKPAGGTSGDTLAAAATGDDFSITDGLLEITYLDRDSATITRGGTTGVNFSYEVFAAGGTPEQNDTSNYTVHVRRTSDNAIVDADFTIGAVNYGACSVAESGGSTIAGCFNFNIQAASSASTALTYYVSVERIGSPTLNPYDSNAGTTGGNIGLAASGEFTVVNDTNLNVQFLSRDNANFQRQDGTGVNYYYRLLYANGDEMTTEGANHTLGVYDSGDALISDNGGGGSNPAYFNFGAPSYAAHAGCGGGSCWEVNITADKTATATTGYYVQVEKTAGTDQTGTSHSSKDGDNTNATTGVFEVEYANLTATFTGPGAAATLRRWTADQVDYSFRLFYPDGTTQATGTDLNPADIDLIVFDNIGGADRSAQFTEASALAYNGGTTQWEVSFTGQSGTTTPSTNYVLRLGNNAGAHDVVPTEDSDADLGANGRFTVYSHLVQFASRSAATVQRAPLPAGRLTYTYNILADGSGADETANAGSQVLRILDNGNTDVTARFTISSGPTWNGSAWEVEFYPNGSGTLAPITLTASTADDYSLEVTKNLDGGQSSLADTLESNQTGSGFASPANDGGFDILETELSVVYNGNSNATFQKVDGTGTRFTFDLVYGDGTTELTTDAASINVTVRRVSDDADITGQFNLTGPTYAGGQWRVDVEGTTTTQTPAPTFDEDFYIDIDKAAGTSGDPITTAVASNDGAQLAGAGESTVQAANLTLTILSRSTNRFSRNDGTGVDFTYRVFYPDGATQHTGNAADYTIKVLDNTAADVTSQFTVGTPAYDGTNNWWSVNIQADLDADLTYYDNHYITVEKAVNGGDDAEKDTLAAEASTVDLAAADPVSGTTGAFDVANLTVDWDADPAGANQVKRGSSAGVDFGFTVYEGDGSTAYTDGTLTNTDVLVYDRFNVDQTANFTVGVTDNGSGNYTVNIRPDETATIDTGYYLVVGFNGGTSDYLQNFASNNPTAAQPSNGLGTTDGEFDVIESDELTIAWQSRTTASVERAGGANVTYRFKAFYSDGTEHTDTNAPNGYEARVLDTTPAEIASGFAVSAIAYNGAACTTGCWEFTVTPDETVDPQSENFDYLVAVRKISTGANPDETQTDGTTLGVDRYADIDSDGNGGFLMSDASTVGGLDTGLPGNGGEDGRFTVTYATLNLTNQSLGGSPVEQADSTNISFNYQIEYDDNTLLSSPPGATTHTARIYETNSGGTERTGEFNITGPTWNGGSSSYDVTVQPLKGTTAFSDYKVCIEIAGGGSPNGDSLSVTCSTAGFEVTEATLNAVYSAPVFQSGTDIPRGEDKTSNYVTLQFDLRYDVNTDDAAGELRLSDINAGNISASGDVVSNEFAIEVQQSGAGADLSQYFYWWDNEASGWVDADPDDDDTVDNPVKPFWNSGDNKWEVRLAPKYRATVQTYNINVTYDGTLGDSDDTLAATDSSDFDVSNGQWVAQIVHRDDSRTVFERANGALGDTGTDGGTTYYFTVKWPDGDTPYLGDGVVTDVGDGTGTVDSGTFGIPTVSVRQDGAPGTDVSADFQISGDGTNGNPPVFGNYGAANCDPVGSTITHCWRVNLVPLPSAPADNDLTLALEKTTGDDRLTLLRSDDGTNGLGDGTGAGQGEFEVQIGTLNIYWEDISVNEFDRADGAGVTYRWRLFYDDMTTEATSTEIGDPSEFSISVLTENTTTDQTANFTITDDGSTNADQPRYNAGFWEVNIQSLPTANAGGHHIVVSKAAGTNTDTLDNKHSIYVSNDGADEAIEAAGADGVIGQDPDSDADFSKTKLVTWVDEDTAGDGVFKVTFEQQMVVKYTHRTTDRFNRNGAGTTNRTIFYFRVLYNDGSEFTDTTDGNYGAGDWNNIVRDNSDVDVTANFNPSISYQTGLSATECGAGNTACWEYIVEGTTSSPVGENFYVEINKPNRSGSGGSGDELPAYSSKAADDGGSPQSNTGLDLANGVFATTNLKLHFISRANAVMEQYAAAGDESTYYFQLFDNTYGGTEVTDADFDGNLGLTVFDGSDADVTTDFDITGPVYTSDSSCPGSINCWKIVLKGNSATTVGAGHYITLNGDYSDSTGSTDSMLPYNSENSDDGGTTETDGLGTTDGVFELTDATLNIAYTANTGPGSFEKMDGLGVNYYYRIFYDDGTEVTTEAGAQTVTVLNSSAADVTVDFSPSVSYQTGLTATECGSGYSEPDTACWRANVQAQISATAAAGYYINISKAVGTSNDTLAGLDSNTAPPADSLGNLGLGTGTTPGGEFEVKAAKFLIQYISQSTGSVTRGSGNSINYKFDILYKDESTEENGSVVSYYARVYDPGGDGNPGGGDDTNITEKFAGSSGSGASAQINLVSGTHFVSEGACAAGAGLGDNDNNCWSLDLEPTGTATVASDMFIVVRGTGSGGTLGDLGGGEDNDTYSSSGSVSATGSSLFHKGLQGETPDGLFDISRANLHVVYQSLGGSPVQRLATTGDGALYKYRVQYPSGEDETNDTGYAITVHDAGDDSDVTANFDFYDWGGTSWKTDGFDETVNLTYDPTDRWQVKIRPKADTATGDYYIQVAKTPGGPEDDQIVGQISSNLSTTPDGDGNAGLNAGGNEGNFTADPADFSVTYLTRSAASIGRADGTGVDYTFDILFPDGTEATDSGATAIDISSLTLAVYDSGASLVESGPGNTSTGTEDGSTKFTIGAASYSGGDWTLNIKALAPDVASDNVATDYELAVTKAAGTDGNTLAGGATNRSGDGGQLGAGGRFAVTNSALTLAITDKDSTQSGGSAGHIELADDGVTYQFTATYPDGSTQEANDYDYIVRVYKINAPNAGLTDTFTIANGVTYSTDGANKIVGSRFTLQSFVYDTDHWAFNLRALTTAEIDDYRISVEKADDGGAGTNEGDTGAERFSNTTTNSLANTLAENTGGLFHVDPATLNLVYLARDTATIERLGVRSTFYFRFFYDDMSTQFTTPGTNIDVTVFDGGGTDVGDTSGSGEFLVGEDTAQIPEYGTYAQCGGGDCWRVTISALEDAIVATDYRLGVAKPGGGNTVFQPTDTGNINNYYLSDMGTGDVNSNNQGLGDGLGAGNGEVEVSDPTLNIYYSFRENASHVRHTGGTNATYYYFHLFYDDEKTQAANAGSGAIEFNNSALFYATVLDDTSNDDTTDFNRGTTGAPTQIYPEWVTDANCDPGGAFSTDYPSMANPGQCWRLRVEATASAAVTDTGAGDYYRIDLVKTAGSGGAEPATLSGSFPSDSTTSGLNKGLGAGGGRFDVNPATDQFSADSWVRAHLVNNHGSAAFDPDGGSVTAVDEQTAERADNGVRFRFNMRYPDGTTEDPASQTGYLFRVCTTDCSGGNNKTSQMEFWNFNSNAYEELTTFSGDDHSDYYRYNGSASAFEVIVRPKKDANLTGASSYRLYVHKEAGSAAGSEDLISAASALSSGTVHFDVGAGKLNPVYIGLDSHAIDRGTSSDQLNYSYRVLYGDNGTQFVTADDTREGGSWNITVWRDDGAGGTTDVTTDFNIGTPSYDATCDSNNGCWSVALDAKGSAAVTSPDDPTVQDDFYYISMTYTGGDDTLQPESGRTGIGIADEASPYYSVESATKTGHGSVALGANSQAAGALPDNGGFDVEPGTVHIVFIDPAASPNFNTRIRRLHQGDYDSAKFFAFEARYPDYATNSTVETNDTGYAVRVLDSDGTNATAQFAFWNFNSGAWDPAGTAFTQSDHMSLNGTRWEVAVRPGKTATVYRADESAETYTIEVKKDPGGEGDVTSDPGDGNRFVSSNASTTADAVGNEGFDAGGNEGRFEIFGARLYTQYLAQESIVVDFANQSMASYDVTDFTTYAANATFTTAAGSTPNLEQASNGTRFNFQVYYPDGTQESVNVNDYTITVLDSGGSPVPAGEFNVDAPQYDATCDSGNGCYRVVVRPTVENDNVDTGYKILVTKDVPATGKNAAADTLNRAGAQDATTGDFSGDLGAGTYYPAAQVTSDGNTAETPASGTYVANGNIALGATNGRFNITQASLNMQYVSRTSNNPADASVMEDLDGTIYRGAASDKNGYEVTYKFRIVYDDNVTQATDSGDSAIDVANDMFVVLWDRNGWGLPYSATGSNTELRMADPAYSGSDGDCDFSTAGGNVNGCWELSVNAPANYLPPDEENSGSFSSRSLFFEDINDQNTVGIDLFLGFYSDSEATGNYSTLDADGPAAGPPVPASAIAGTINGDTLSLSTPTTAVPATSTQKTSAGESYLGVKDLLTYADRNDANFPANALGGAFSITFSKQLYLRYYAQDTNSARRGGTDGIVFNFNIFYDDGGFIENIPGSDPLHPSKYTYRVYRQGDDQLVFDSSAPTANDQFEMVSGSFQRVKRSGFSGTCPTGTDIKDAANPETEEVKCFWQAEVRPLAPTVNNVSDQFYLAVSLNSTQYIQEAPSKGTYSSVNPWPVGALANSGLATDHPELASGFGGIFGLTNKTNLRPDFGEFTMDNIRKGDETGTDFTFNFFYDNPNVRFVNQPANDNELASLKIRVYKEIGESVDEDVTDAFTITTPEYMVNGDSACPRNDDGSEGQCWKFNIQADNTSPATIEDRYYVGVYKLAGLTSDASDATTVNQDGEQVLDLSEAGNTAFLSSGVAQYFNLEPAIINAVFEKLSPTQISPGDKTVARVRFNYADGAPVIAGIQPANFRVLEFLKRGNGPDRSSDFSDIQVSHDQENCDTDLTQKNCGLWKVNVKANKKIKNHSNIGYVVKASGSDEFSNVVEAKESSADIGGAFDAGVFYVYMGDELYQNYPNPFNPEAGEITKIRFDLKNLNGFEVFHIYTASGVRVREFDKSDLTNRNMVIWNGRNDDGDMVGTGVYIGILKTADFRKTIKIVVEKK